MFVQPQPKIENQFIIKGQKTPKAIVITLSILLILFFLIPLISTAFILASGKGFSAGPFFMFVIFWGIAFYLLRVVLWNSCGKEVLTLYENKLSYHSDFKFFIDSKQEINRDGLVIEIVQTNDSKNQFGYLKLTNKDKTIETVLKADIQELSIIVNEIKHATTGR